MSKRSDPITDPVQEAMAKAMQTILKLEAEDLAILEAIQKEFGLFSRAQALRYALRKYAELMRLAVSKSPASRG